ncbi:acid--CoA ligase [Azorhizobium oxalatiphilum]|uniref:Acid--CoA ligase n=1 Tax=Azorhizobium oxalatiphilum TaxID=980631 RepID=A0A917BWH5_9HYPH|nr:class I adenylate-forming enzyme family protein [Azorhizobium oxalatiphilum]GGF61661.1 acid--CoA ligase [Azorhizobium oxalatiphilum]
MSVLEAPVTAVPLGPQTRWTNLGDLIDRTADLSRPALIDLSTPTPRQYSHAEVDGLANGVARFLTDRGLKRGDRVAILSLNRAEYLISFLGIMRAGFVAVPVNVKLPQETVDYVLADADAHFAFVDKGGRAFVEGKLPFAEFDDAGETGFAAVIKPTTFETVAMNDTDIGQMLYTSGSTGKPKGVPLSHRGQLWALFMRTQNGKTQPTERVMIAQPLFHMNGLFSAKSAFATTASIVLMPGFDVRPYVKAISDWKVTALGSVPTMFARIVKDADYVRTLDTTSLKRIMMGSAPVTLALFERVKELFPNAVIALGFGTTEAGPAIFGPHPDGRPTPPGSLGYPVPGSEVKLIEASDFPDGSQEGVLMMRNPSLMYGYHGLPAQTAKALRDGWYYSGDVLRRDKDGFYYFVGRADDMFVCSGENIYPVEVEKMLERHADVQQASVVPLPDEERGQMPVAFIVARPGAHPTYGELKTFSLANGPAYQHPRRVEFVDDLPWAGTNKVDRKALIARARELEASGGWSK